MCTVYVRVAWLSHIAAAVLLRWWWTDHNDNELPCIGQLRLDVLVAKESHRCRRRHAKSVIGIDLLFLVVIHRKRGQGIKQKQQAAASTSTAIATSSCRCIWLCLVQHPEIDQNRKRGR